MKALSRHIKSRPAKSFVAIALIGLAVCGCSQKKAEHSKSAAAATLHHWTYGGDDGPDHWAQLGDDNVVCGNGERQSPVDIAGTTKVTTSHVVLDYRSSAATIQNNGHMVVVTPDSGGAIVVDGTRYTLKSFQFHSPSEHAINGRKTAMETQFIHQSDKGDTLIIAVLSDVGTADPMLGSLWTYLPFDAGKPIPLPDLLVNAQDLMPATEDFYVYSGSLTTPPCTEAVTWMVYSSPLSLSPEQADAIARISGPNARPLQQRHDRYFLHVSGS